MNRLVTRLNLFIIMGIIQLAGFSIVCYGEPGTPSEQPLKDTPDFAYPGADTASTLWMVVKVVFFLIVIIGIFFVIVKFLSQKNKSLFGRSLRSLGGVPLGPNKSIQVVEIGRSLYIVGVGDNVQLIEKINDEEEVAYITSMLTNNSIGTPNFESLSGWWNKLRNKQEQPEDEDITASFQQVFHDKMQHLSDRKKRVDELLMDDNNKDRLNDKP
ncbi:flagellar biosynthetic protein FliO [Paenibacillus sp. UNC451MF]|uniref:flagellar biosynthetic protein FliO n=1 Tax=Paenibacillus sp. UNC451MF TaxID=1449063 RepID=UPI001E50C3E7|nr:flagellar biosynthetic protein FliO [Paenibacillus sp. UNC451MF]